MNSDAKVSNEDRLSRFVRETLINPGQVDDFTASQQSDNDVEHPAAVIHAHGDFGHADYGHADYGHADFGHADR